MSDCQSCNRPIRRREELGIWTHTDTGLRTCTGLKTVATPADTPNPDTEAKLLKRVCQLRRTVERLASTDAMIPDLIDNGRELQARINFAQTMLDSDADGLENLAQITITLRPSEVRQSIDPNLYVDQALARHDIIRAAVQIAKQYQLYITTQD